MTKTKKGALVFPVPDWGDEVLRVDPATVALERRIATSRPRPPEAVGDDVPECFVADVAFGEWMRGTFINGGAPLANERYEHLVDASIGVLWTNVIMVRGQRHVLATAEIPQNMGTKWKQGRAEQQIREWFQFVPDFLLTFYAPEMLMLDDRAFCALVEHELCHCGQKQDRYGAPMFSRETGQPVFELIGHDVEEFTDVVRRYGITTPALREMVAASNARPLVNDLVIANACGNCRAAA